MVVFNGRTVGDYTKNGAGYSFPRHTSGTAPSVPAKLYPAPFFRDIVGALRFAVQAKL